MSDSDWWEECVNPRSKPRIRDKQAAADTKAWKKVLAEALSNQNTDDHLQQRRKAAYLLTRRATCVWIDKVHAGRKRSGAHTAQRLAAGGAAAAAAGSGAALAVGLSGTPAKVWGIVIVGVGVAAGAVAAVWPEAEYERNRDKARQYEQLWQDMWTYVTLVLPTVDPDSIDHDVKGFSARFEAVGGP